MSEIRANSITDAAGTGAPNFPNGLESDGVAVATTADIPSVNSALEFISSATISNVATVDFTGFDSSKYSDYVFNLSNVIPVTDNQTLFLFMSTDGGSTYLSSYGYNRLTVESVATAISYIASANTSLPLAPNVGSDTNEFGVSGEVRVFGPDLVARTPIVATLRLISSSAQLWTSITSGQNEVTTEVNAVRFLFSSGNLESGRITMYGVRNS
jgi:hypothetical protein